MPIASALIGAALLVQPPSGAAAGPQEAAGLRRCLEKEIGRSDFSGVAQVTLGERVIAQAVRGRTEGSKGAPIALSSRFNLGSVSKMFTAVAVGQLIDAGKVELDGPLGRYVGGLTPEASAVTVRQLLDHSGGLGDFFSPASVDVLEKARSASDLLPLVAGAKPSFPPGSRFEYSNTGFLLLGVVIERVSGMTYAEYLRRHVFAPAGMIDAGPDPAPVDRLAVAMTNLPALAPEGSATGSSGPGRPPGPPSLPSPPQGLVLIGPGGPLPPGGPLREAPGARAALGSPAGGLFGTAGDLQRFAKALADGRLVSAQTLHALTSPQIVAVPATAERPARSYGLGFGVGVEQGQPWFGHNGGTAGANVEFATFAQVRLTITVLSNRDPPMATNLFRKLRAWSLDDLAGRPVDGC